MEGQRGRTFTESYCVALPTGEATVTVRGGSAAPLGYPILTDGSAHNLRYFGGLHRQTHTLGTGTGTIHLPQMNNL